jgi:hypothetical protein
LQDRLDQMQILFPTKARLLGMHWDDQSDWNKPFRSLDWEAKQVKRSVLCASVSDETCQLIFYGNLSCNTALLQQL